MNLRDKFTEETGTSIKVYPMMYVEWLESKLSQPQQDKMVEALIDRIEKRKDAISEAIDYYDVAEFELNWMQDFLKNYNQALTEAKEGVKEKAVCDIPGCFKIAPQNHIFCKGHRDAEVKEGGGDE